MLDSLEQQKQAHLIVSLDVKEPIESMHLLSYKSTQRVMTWNL